MEISGLTGLHSFALVLDRFQLVHSSLQDARCARHPQDGWQLLDHQASYLVSFYFFVISLLFSLQSANSLLSCLSSARPADSSSTSLPAPPKEPPPSSAETTSTCLPSPSHPSLSLPPPAPASPTSSFGRPSPSASRPSPGRPVPRPSTPTTPRAALRRGTSTRLTSAACRERPGSTFSLRSVLKVAGTGLERSFAASLLLLPAFLIALRPVRILFLSPPFPPPPFFRSEPPTDPSCASTLQTVSPSSSGSRPTKPSAFPSQPDSTTAPLLLLSTAPALPAGDGTLRSLGQSSLCFSFPAEPLLMPSPLHILQLHS
jgi:hypothetical protein